MTSSRAESLLSFLLLHAFPISVWGKQDEISYPTRAASVDYTGLTRGHKKRRYLSD